MRKSAIPALLSLVVLGISLFLAIWGEILGLSEKVVSAWGATAVVFMVVTTISGWISLCIYDEEKIERRQDFEHYSRRN
jgi:hypothetical protein